MNQELFDVRRVDPSGRLSLGRTHAGEQFEIREERDGRILLIPVVTIPRSELWLHQNPEAKQLLAQGLADAAAGRTVDGGDFSQFLDEEDLL